MAAGEVAFGSPPNLRSTFASPPVAFQRGGASLKQRVKFRVVAHALIVVTGPEWSMVTNNYREMIMDRYTFVLQHGACHYGELFDEVAGHLRYSGHRVYAPTAAGNGPDADPSATLADAVDSIERYFVDNDLRDVVFYGHSWGGVILTQVAPRIADRIRRLVFHNALIVADGSSAQDEAPPGAPLPPPEGGLIPQVVWRNSYIQDATAAESAYRYEMLTPQFPVMLTTKLDQKPFYKLVDDGTVPMSWLSFAGDVALPPGDYGWIPRFPRRLGFPREVYMPCRSHEVMFTAPRTLAEAIVMAGRD